MLGLLTITMAACTTAMYDGAPRPDGELATLVGDRMYLVSVDGKPVPYSGGNFATIKVLPGQRTITARLNDAGPYRTVTSNAEPPVTFSAVAGRRYAIQPQFVERQRWYPQVIDVHTGEVVGRAD
ncbi:hypothetical protein [Methylibium petroleiphilum]|nr:hypothetical protein [Methylibium petroleiphilum]